MTAIILALACAAGYGASDFLAGLASRRASYLRVAIVVQGVAMVSVLLAVPFVSGRLTLEGVLWGTFSGIGSGTGALALYRGLGRAQMSVVGPISGVGAAAIPALGGLALGERPSPVTLVGVALILPAVWLIARESEGARAPARVGTADGVAAGVGFGVFFLTLSRAGSGDGLWPGAASAVTSAVVVTGFCVTQGAGRRRDGSGLTAVAAAAGVCAGGAYALYLLATRRGLLVVVAVLAALYPAVTVVLARTFLHERSSRGQVVGLALAAGAVAAITAG